MRERGRGWREGRIKESGEYKREVHHFYKHGTQASLVRLFSRGRRYKKGEWREEKKLYPI
jgi:hypothetical protein